MNTPSIEQLMRLVQDEGYFYTVDYNSSSEIRFSKREDSDGPAGWGWRIDRIGQYERFDPDTAVQLFNEKQVNMAIVHSELLSSVAASASYHRIRTKEINKVMGADFSHDAEREMERFGDELVKAVEGALRKSKIKLVEN